MPLTKQQLIWGASIIGCLFLIIIVWMFSASIRDTFRAWSKASSSQEVSDARATAEKAKADAENAKQIAADALKDLTETKQRLAQQLEITKAAEVKLFDSNKISEASKEDYEATKNKVLATTYHSTNPNLNTDELCERAKSLGISCE